MGDFPTPAPAPGVSPPSPPPPVLANVGTVRAAAGAQFTAPILFNGYFSFVFPVGGDQKLLVQLYQPPRVKQWALLRLKVAGDGGEPAETVFPTKGVLAPTVTSQSPTKIVIALGEGSRDVDIRYSAGWETQTFDAIKADDPFGSLLMDAVFRRAYFEGVFVHPQGTQHYGHWGSFPDEAIAQPVWGPFVHPSLGFMYRANSGKYQGRAVRIDYAEKASFYALRDGMLEGAKFMAEVAIMSIPYVGPLVLLGQALVGRTIWGEKLSTEGRVLLGLFVVLPFVAREVSLAKAAAEDLKAASSLASSKGIAETEALRVIRGVRTFSTEERQFIVDAEARLEKGVALSRGDAEHLARLTNRIGEEARLVFNAPTKNGDVELIFGSKRFQAGAEGSAYGMRIPLDSFWSRLRAGVHKAREGLVIFEGQAADLFAPHAVEGPFSGWKFLAGQQKAGFADIILDEAYLEGRTVIVTKAHMATPAEALFKGQTKTIALARLWGRRLFIEPAALMALASAGYLLYTFGEWLDEP